jgi:hypothetical protein
LIRWIWGDFAGISERAADAADLQVIFADSLAPQERHLAYGAPAERASGG